MKSFKRTIDSKGIIRYFINGKQITAKKGAKIYVQQNFKSLKKQDLSKTESRSYTARQNAQKGAVKAKRRAQLAFRFNGRFIDRGLKQFIEKYFAPGTNLNEEFPKAKDYGEFLKQLQTQFKNTLQRFELKDVSQYGLPNEKRGRKNPESTADFVEMLENDYPGYIFRLIGKDGKKYTGKKALAALARFETKEIKKAGEKSAYAKFSYFPSIDYTEKIIELDLTDEENYDITIMDSP